MVASARWMLLLSPVAVLVVVVLAVVAVVFVLLLQRSSDMGLSSGRLTAGARRPTPTLPPVEESSSFSVLASFSASVARCNQITGRSEM